MPRANLSVEHNYTRMPSATAATATTTAAAMCSVQRDDVRCGAVRVEHDLARVSDPPSTTICATTPAVQIATVYRYAQHQVELFRAYCVSASIHSWANDRI